MDTADKSLTADRINWVKFSGARWAPDSKGFYYSAYDAPKKSAYSSKNEFQKVYYHELGTPQSADKLVYEDKAHPLRYFSAGAFRGRQVALHRGLGGYVGLRDPL